MGEGGSGVRKASFFSEEFEPARGVGALQALLKRLA